MNQSNMGLVVIYMQSAPKSSGWLFWLKKTFEVTNVDSCVKAHFFSYHTTTNGLIPVSSKWQVQRTLFEGLKPKQDPYRSLRIPTGGQAWGLEQGGIYRKLSH